ncbi:PQQ-dependent sugar dehydrogenase [Thiolapillus sp.]
MGTASAAPPADLDLTLVTTITDGWPLAVRHAGDGSGRIFIVTQQGKIFVHDGNQLLPTPFLDISDRVYTPCCIGDERGLLGLDFHPGFAMVGGDHEGEFFVNYSDRSGGDTVVSRFKVSSSTPNVADAGSEEILLEVDQPHGNHNGGDIHFGPDGYLYIGMGDGGSARDPDDLARKTNNLLGKMLRIDVNGSSPGSGACGLIGNYGVPSSNPFVGVSGACAEIWAYGLRNPWRWSFDRATHDMFIGDVGQGEWEEVDFQPAGSTGGEYYGWSCMEGNHVMISSRCDATPRVAPILEYYHSGGNCSITGGYRYRGPIPGMNGIYMYADYCTGKIWFAEHTGGGWSSTEWRDTNLNISSFGEDEAGNVYVVDLGGAVYRFEMPAVANDCTQAREVVTGVIQNGEVFNCIADESIEVEDLVVEAGGHAILRAPVVRFVEDATDPQPIDISGTMQVSQ